MFLRISRKQEGRLIPLRQRTVRSVPGPINSSQGENQDLASGGYSSLSEKATSMATRRAAGSARRMPKKGGFSMSISALRSLSARSRILNTEAAGVGGRRVSAIGQQTRKPRALQNHHNYRIKEKTMKSFGWMVMSSLAVFLVATSTSWAQPGPSEPTCGQRVTAGGDTETSIKVCMEAQLEEQALMVAALRNMCNEMERLNLSSFIAERYGLRVSGIGEDLTADLQFLDDELTRAVDGNEASEDADYDASFESADKEKGDRCKLSDELFIASLNGDNPPGLKPLNGTRLADFDIRFGDGKCNVFKALIDNPGGIGDNDEVLVNERREDMCELVCQDRGNPNNRDRPRKDERKERAAARVTDSIAATGRATVALNDVTANLFALRLKLSRDEFRSLDQSDVCQSGFDLRDDFDVMLAKLSVASNALSIVHAIASGITGVISPPADQAVAGFNAAMAKLVTNVVAGLANTAKAIVNTVQASAVLRVETINFAQADASKSCIKSVRDEFKHVCVGGESAGDICGAKADCGTGTCEAGAIVMLTDGLFAEFMCDGGKNAGKTCDRNVDCQGGTCDTENGGAILKLLQGGNDTEVALQRIMEDVAELRSLVEANRDLLLTPPGQRKGGFRPPR